MELRLALRNLHRRRMVSVAVVLAVSLATAVTAAVFSVLDGLLYRPLPFRDADQLMHVEYRRDRPQLVELAVLPEFASWREALRESVLHSPLVAGASQAGGGGFFDRADAEESGLRVEGVDSAFFPLLGLSPVMGSNFSSSDERSPATASRTDPSPLPVIIGYDIWKGRYAGDPQIIGVRALGGRTVRIVGVMGPGVKFPGETTVWAPVSATRSGPPAYARLAQGASVAQLAAAFPDLLFTPLRDTARPRALGGLPLLLAAAGILLLVTWVQVTALTFVGSMGQLHDIGVCLSLGAGRRRIVLQAAIENGVIAGAACGVAWLVTRPLTVFVVGMLPAGLTRGQYLNPDLRTLTFICAISLAGFAVLTTIPFMAAREGGLLSLLNGRVTNRALSMDRLRRSFLVAQVTLTVVLLYLCGVAAHSFANAAAFDYGFDADHVLLFTPPTWARYGRTGRESMADFALHNERVRRTVESLETTPGVKAAALIVSAPFGVGEAYDLTPIEPDSPSAGVIMARPTYVGADFVRAFGATLVAGQSLDDPANRERDDVVLVNQTLANRLAPPIRVPGGAVLAPPVIGRPFRWKGWTFRIVGVVGDLFDGPGVTPDPQFFRRTRVGRFVVVRSEDPMDVTLPRIRTALGHEWGFLRTGGLIPMREKLTAVLTPLRSDSILLAVIAGCCLPIAWIGVMGAVLYSVRIRRREIAVRLAMGADPVRVQRAVTMRALATISVGVLVGLGLGMLAQAVLGHLFFRVRAADPLTIMAVAAGTVMLCWFAAAVPAREASRLDPSIVLREG